MGARSRLLTICGIGSIFIVPIHAQMSDGLGPSRDAAPSVQFGQGFQDIAPSPAPGKPGTIQTLPKVEPPEGVQRGREAVITASEYLHAVNRLKSAAGPMAWISAPLLSEVPTLAPVMGLGSDGSQHPAQKLVPLLADFGADDLGVIDASMIKVTRLMEDIRSAGLSFEVQGGGQLLKDDTADGTWDKCDDSRLDLRHKPADRI